jgi:short-subunit dehydrogenase
VVPCPSNVSYNTTLQVVVICGASQGIGAEIAFEYATHGAKLVLAARNEDKLIRVAHDARKKGSPKVLLVQFNLKSTPTSIPFNCFTLLPSPQVSILAVDLSTRNGAESLINLTRSEFGSMDILVLNHAVYNHGVFDAR